MKFSLPSDVLEIISRLESKGYRADVVGGPVRDFLLGKTPSDFDITTSALPCEVKAVFSDMRTVDTGIKHGTVSLIIGGEQYEVTTYRVDGEYKDSRHPDSVTFTDRLELDLSRRDFTVNAMAYSPRWGLTDVFCGKCDLDGKIIRTVGEPELRFSEDALRILRGVRFASVLGFSVEEKTAEAIHALAPTLELVSAERIFVELKKLLGGVSAYRTLVEFADVIATVIPELSELVLPDEGRFSSANFYTRMLSLFALSVKSRPDEAFSAAMRRLKSDNPTRTLGAAVLSELGKHTLDSPASAARLLSVLGERGALELVKLEALLSRFGEREAAILSEAIAKKLPYRISDLAIGGEDIASLGAVGKEIGVMLSSLLEAVISGGVPNERAALLECAAKLKAKHRI
jgi:tRNA nucleotidyltransferase (CCA-adding enzyme)